MDACFVNEIGVTTVSQKFKDLDENITGMCLFSKWLIVTAILSLTFKVVGSIYILHESTTWVSEPPHCNSPSSKL